MTRNFPVSRPNRELFQSRLSQLAKEGGRNSRKDLSAITGVPVSSLDKYAAGSREPSFDYLVQIAEGAGVSLDWLAGLSDDRSRSSEGSFVAIPLLPEAVSAGGGMVAEANDWRVDRLLMFRREWMARIGVNPLRAHVLRVIGDSMEPTLFEGDVVLADVGDQSILGGGLFVVLLEDGPAVKRLDRDDDGAVLVLSDNDRYRARRVVPPLADTFRIIGRVRWYARTLR